MESHRRDVPGNLEDENTSGACATSPTPSLPSDMDNNDTVCAPKEHSSSSSKPLSIPKFHSLIKMRQKLLRRLKQLEEREVCFDDEAKELFYINNERKLKKAILDIERTLHKHGALEDLDENLQAFHNGNASVEISIMDTGNEFLNQRLNKLISQKNLKKEKTVTPSFDELRDLMCELREEQGSASGIPDPILENEAFLDRLENIAFVTVRSHQNFISTQFLENVDLYVPEEDRPRCSKLPELNTDMEKLLSASGSASCLPDEIFRMEMKVAGRQELADSQGSSAIQDEIDLMLNGDADSGREDLSDDELEYDENDCDLHGSSPGQYSPSQTADGPEPTRESEDFPTLSVDFDLERLESQTADASIVLQETRVFASSVFSEHGYRNECEPYGMRDERKAVKRVAEWLQNVEPAKMALIEVSSDDDSCMNECNVNSVKRELPATENQSNGDQLSDFSDSGEIECLGVFHRSPGSGAVSNSSKHRCSKKSANSTNSVSPSDVVEVICIDD
ncbi:hypothetical protein RB195_007403 [Necator americanus]|uniref:Fibrous sheath-interacting protein 1 n=1 Tax=Necator americanus TaxID=51031 RepID=A0ABR1BX52_NECAM